MNGNSIGTNIATCAAVERLIASIDNSAIDDLRQGVNEVRDLVDDRSPKEEKAWYWPYPDDAEGGGLSLNKWSLHANPHDNGSRITPGGAGWIAQKTMQTGFAIGWTQLSPLLMWTGLSHWITGKSFHRYLALGFYRSTDDQTIFLVAGAIVRANDCPYRWHTLSAGRWALREVRRRIRGGMCPCPMA